MSPEGRDPGRRPGLLYAGTSGFAYPGWVPRFYEPGKASRKLLVAYSARLAAVELHHTFYRRPPAETVARWLRETPEDFRFCPKAQRGTAFRAWSDEDPGEAFRWLAGSFESFGERLGCVLLSTRRGLERDDAALAQVLGAWPAGLPLALELLHPSWQADEVYALLDGAGVTLVANDWDDADEPDLRRIGRFVYVRLRRTAYSTEDVARWAARIEPFLADGVDVYAFFRHDEDGEMALHAEALQAAVRDLMGT